MSKLWPQNPERCQAIIDHAILLGNADANTNTRSKIYFSGFLSGANAINSPALIIYINHSLLSTTHSFAVDAQGMSRECMHMLETQLGLSKPQSAMEIADYVEQLDQLFQSAAPGRSALFILPHLDKWDVLSTIGSKHKQV